MSFTNDNDLEIQTSGQADWDTGLNANFQIIERGFHIRATAGSDISTGQICIVNNSAYMVPYDARSISLTHPTAISYKSVSSGESSTFVREGIVRSMAIWSGHIAMGQPVFSSPTSLGFAVSSYLGADYPIGTAIGADAVWVSPSRFRTRPDLVTHTQTVAALIGNNSAAAFTVPLANRGYARQLRVVSQSADAYKVQFHSGSSRVSSELLYDTLTRSVAAGNSVDVNTLSYLDQAMFPWYNTDAASPYLVHGRIYVQSGSAVSSGLFTVTVEVERFR